MGSRLMSRGAVAVAVFLAISATAAASSGSSRQSSGERAAAASAAARAGTVKIGVLVDLTGELGSFGKTWSNSFQLAVDDVNKVGGLPGGVRLETVIQDEKTDPAAALTLARAMISNDKVAAIVGPTSGAMIALVPLAKRSRVPIVSQAAGDVTLNRLGGDYIYRTVASDNSDGAAAAKFLIDKGAKSVAVVFQNEASPASVGSTFVSAFKASGGTVSKTIAINPSQTSYQAEVQQALSGKPAWIFCACGQQSGAVFLRQAYAAGYRGDWMVAADLVVPEVIKAVGSKVMAGMYGEESAPDTSLPAYKAFAASYKARFHKAPGFFASNSYDAVVLLALAMVKARSVKGADIDAALRSVADPPGKVVTSYAAGLAALKAGKEINYQGASGPVDFDKSGTVRGSYAIFQVRGNAWKEVRFYRAASLPTQR